MYSFPYLELVFYSMSSSNCCFLTWMQISQEPGQGFGTPNSFRIFQFVVIHTVKGFGIVNKAEVDAFLEVSCFVDDPMDVVNLISGSSAFSKSKFIIMTIIKLIFKNQFYQIWCLDPACVCFWMIFLFCCCF